MCDINAPVIELAQSFARDRVGNGIGIFLASDHENALVEKLVYNTGGKSFEYNAEVVFALNPARQTFPTEANSRMGWRKNIQGVLLDMLILSKTDVFFGNPGSTLSQVVCYWRMAAARENLGFEFSNSCGLVLMSTGAKDSKDISC